jgi:amino acid adenylation domain-containing protein
MAVIDEIRLVAKSKKNNVALQSAKGERLTYQQLMQRAEGLAATLRKGNFAPGERIVIALPRSVEMIIAILGVMAAGSTFIPMDPSHPSSRLISILEDSKPACILCEKEDEHLFVASGIPCIHPGKWLSRGTVSKTTSSAPAYIIYTSGSTGTPKGVVIGNTALENYINWALNALPFTGGGVPLFTSLSFDHALTNIFPPLLKGECIHLLASIEGGRTLASALLSERKQPYSYVKITPSLFCFLDKAQRAQLGNITHLLMFGGEKLISALLADARAERKELIILNHYGPTETTVGCCVFQVPLNFSGTIVPIGQPLPGVEVSIRGKDLKPVKDGETGELFVSGAALADEYWQQPQLTEKTFLKIQENAKAQRWYRTGDQARMTKEGNIEYLGRTDDQIKILGTRIEPLEIIASLNAFPGVKQATVFTVEHASSVELIAALSFYENLPEPEAIRKFLRAQLPPVMIPSRYLILHELPVAASGKADVKQLRAQLSEAVAKDNVEQAVMEKFKEIFGQEQISMDDDYFLLGGDSLGTVEIATWAAEQYQIPLDVACLFNFPTVASLSAHIEELIGEKVNS